jgi:hypothetical protein
MREHARRSSREERRAKQQWASSQIKWCCCISTLLIIAGILGGIIPFLTKTPTFSVLETRFGNCFNAFNQPVANLTYTECLNSTMFTAITIIEVNNPNIISAYLESDFNVENSLFANPLGAGTITKLLIDSNTRQNITANLQFPKSVATGYVLQALFLNHAYYEANMKGDIKISLGELSVKFGLDNAIAIPPP